MARTQPTGSNDTKARLKPGLRLLGALILASFATACGNGATQYEIAVEFNASVTQDDLDEVADLLRSFDDDVDFLILERFPPAGRAALATDAPDFCATLEPELAAKSYVESASCEPE